MNLAQTATRHQFQARLDELHEISIALYAEVVAVMQRIEEIAIEREQVYREWETSWNEPTPAVTPAVTTTAPTPTVTPAVKTISAKKLMLSLVSVKRIVSDVPVCNEDRNELKIAGKLSLAHGRLITPPGARRDSNGYKVVADHFQYHAAERAHRLNPGPRKASISQRSCLKRKIKRRPSAQLKMLKDRAA